MRLGSWLDQLSARQSRTTRERLWRLLLHGLLAEVQLLEDSTTSVDAERKPRRENALGECRLHSGAPVSNSHPHFASTDWSRQRYQE